MLCIDCSVKISSWDSSKAREKLRREIEAHTTTVRTEKIAEIITNYEVRLILVLL